MPGFVSPQLLTLPVPIFCRLLEACQVLTSLDFFTLFLGKA